MIMSTNSYNVYSGPAKGKDTIIIILPANKKGWLHYISVLTTNSHIRYHRVIKLRFANMIYYDMRSHLGQVHLPLEVPCISRRSEYKSNISVRVEMTYLLPT